MGYHWQRYCLWATRLRFVGTPWQKPKAAIISREFVELSFLSIPTPASDYPSAECSPSFLQGIRLYQQGWVWCLNCSAIPLGQVVNPGLCVLTGTILFACRTLSSSILCAWDSGLLHIVSLPAGSLLSLLLYQIWTAAHACVHVLHPFHQLLPQIVCRQMPITFMRVYSVLLLITPCISSSISMPRQEMPSETSYIGGVGGIGKSAHNIQHDIPLWSWMFSANLLDESGWEADPTVQELHQTSSPLGMSLNVR